MTGFITMIKMNCRLLYRNIGFMCFLVLLPIAAILLLNITYNTSVSGEEAKIVYLDTKDSRIDTTRQNLVIKIYDYSVSDLSKNLIDFIQGGEIFELYCYQEKGGGMAWPEENLLDVLNRNPVDAIIIIEDNFDELFSQERFNEGIRIFYGHEDFRIGILTGMVNSFLNYPAGINELMPPINDNLSEPESSVFDGIMFSHKSNVMYSWAVITITFALSGVFVSNLIIMERNNGTFKRMRLSDYRMNGYLLVKFLMALLTVVIQILVMGVGILIFVRIDFGISVVEYLGLTFGLALVLNLFSLVLGILINNMLTVSYVAFCLGATLPLISGLFFPGMELKGWLSQASLLTPQRWGVMALDSLLLGDRGPLLDYTLVIVAFIALLGCVSLVGLNIIRKDEG